MQSAATIQGSLSTTLLTTYLYIPNLIHTLTLKDRDGPIHSVAWSPKNPEYRVVHGLSPAKATVFDLKGERILEIGPGPINMVHYNAHGNMLLLGNMLLFGNLPGHVNVWDREAKKIIGIIYIEKYTLGTNYLGCDCREFQIARFDILGMGTRWDSRAHVYDKSSLEKW